MKQLQNRLIFMVAVGIAIMTIVSGIIYYFAFGHSEVNKSEAIIELEVEREASRLDYIMADVERLTTSLYEYHRDTMPDLESLQDEDTYREYVEESMNVARIMAKQHDMVGAVFFRFNKELLGPTAGYFLSKNDSSQELVELPPTNIDNYESSDRGHVAWYYETIENNKAAWIKPYINKNNTLSTLTFSVPLYASDGTLIGIVGTDLDYNMLMKWISEVSLSYPSKAILLSEDASVLFSKAYNHQIDYDTLAKIAAADGELVAYSSKDQNYKAFTYRLLNNNVLAFSVSADDLTYEALRIEMIIILLIILMSTVFICIYTGIIYRVFERAEKDTLTGAYNRDAYSARLSTLEELISFESDRTGISVLVFDVNCLKRTNDKYGHSAGDAMIKNAYKLIAKHFSQYDIYRIGGDEFAIISNNKELIILQNCMNKFKEEMAKAKTEYQDDGKEVIISAGMAYLNRDKHHCYEDIFKEADQRMYEDKEAFYELYPELRR